MRDLLKKLFFSGKQSDHSVPRQSASWDQGWYDGARTNSRLREMLYLPEIDQAQEIDSYDLEELWRKSEFLYNNQGLVRRLVRGSTRYAIGRGIVPAAMTEDREWNAEMEERFDDWAKNAAMFDVSGKMSFYQAQRAAANGMMRIGDMFASLTTTSGRTAPMIQLFEGTAIRGRVGKRPDAPVGQSPRWINGVKVNGQGRALGYALQRGRSLDPVKLDVNKTAHVWDPERVRGVRGRPWASHALLKMLDWREIAAAVTAGVKEDQLQGLIVTSASGAASATGLSGTVPGGVPTAAAKNKRLEQIYGPAARWYMDPGEEVKGFQSDRPDERVEKWMNYLIRDAAWGFGISPELAWSLAGVGGAPMRWILADGQLFFEEVQEILISRFCRRVWIYKVAWDLRAGTIREPRGSKPWWKHSWITPQKVTVDRTKDGKMEVDLIKNALNSIPRYYRALGLEWEDVVDEQIDALSRIKAKAEAAGLALAEVITPAANAGAAAFEEHEEEREESDDAPGEADEADEADDNE